MNDESPETIESRKSMFAAIRTHIESSGFHIYLVSGNQVPAYFYSIGIREKSGFELILAGCMHYESEAIVDIFQTLGNAALIDKDLIRNESPVGSRGKFRFRRVHQTWAGKLAFGAFDFYSTDEIPFYQIVPDEEHFTYDVPNMGVPWGSDRVWNRLDEPWNFDVPEDSLAVTNLDVLQGYYVTECTRWEEGYWEIFSGAGPDVSKEDVRIVPLGILLALDPTLEEVLRLEIGKGIWRSWEDRVWNAWRAKS